MFKKLPITIVKYLVFGYIVWEEGLQETDILLGCIHFYFYCIKQKVISTCDHGSLTENGIGNTSGGG